MEKFTSALSRIYVILGLLLISAGITFSYLKLSGLTFGLNVSESLPQKVFLVKENEPFTRGEIVQFNHKEDEGGFFPNDSRMMKKVIGMPGDNVEFIGSEFYINGVKFGAAKDLSLTGKKLTKNTSKTLGDDEYFVFTPHPDSFDSRYIHMGYISKSQITGKVVKSW